METITYSTYLGGESGKAGWLAPPSPVTRPHVSTYTDQHSILSRSLYSSSKSWVTKNKNNGSSYVVSFAGLAKRRGGGGNNNLDIYLRHGWMDGWLGPHLINIHSTALLLTPKSLLIRCHSDGVLTVLLLALLNCPVGTLTHRSYYENIAVYRGVFGE